VTSSARAAPRRSSSTAASCQARSPSKNFKSRIDEQLKKAEELVKKGTPKAKVYDVLMKTAKADTGGGAPTGAAAEPEAGPVKNVMSGTPPRAGPRNAPLTVVLFSDFQCPFCGRVEPSLTEARKGLPRQGAGGVEELSAFLPQQTPNPRPKLPWPPTSRAKFWEMHDILFRTSRTLDAGQPGEIRERDSAST